MHFMLYSAFGNISRIEDFIQEVRRCKPWDITLKLDFPKLVEH